MTEGGALRVRATPAFRLGICRTMSIELHGYRYSVYAWIARLALAEKGVAHGWHEVDPFAPDVPAAYLALHPFGRVPTLVADGFVLYETAAITRYVDEAFAGPPLQPTDPRERARVAQICSPVCTSWLAWYSNSLTTNRWPGANFFKKLRPL